MRAPRHYETTLDRAGIARSASAARWAGESCSGCCCSAASAIRFALATAWIIGSIFIGIGMTAVAGPLWLVMHVAGLRRARHAALVGALAALAIFVGAQTYGFGLLEMPVIDSRTLLFRWASAVATSAVLAAVAALIGAIMWRIAYRRAR